MTHDWLLVETLGSEPAVVAQGNSTKNLVPISAFLRRNPNLMAIQTAIGETMQAGHPLSSITPKHDRVIRTEVVQMIDGRIHGVHVWIGPLDEEPPQRLIPGPVKWDLTNGVATDTPESLWNSGRNPSTEATHGRAFAEDLPTREMNPDEAHILSAAIKPQPGRAFCKTWALTDHQGTPITVGFVARILLERTDDGSELLMCRAMNWRSLRDESTSDSIDLAQRILNGLAQPGVHRAIVDLRTWTLLKWLDDPCPFYDWRVRASGESFVHPDDAAAMSAMTTGSENGAVAGVLRLRATDGIGWTPIHVTAHRVELEAGTFAALLSLRLPTQDELNDFHPGSPEAAKPRRVRVRRKKQDPANG